MENKSNKEIISHIVNELSKGNDKPLLDSMAEDMQWNWMGSGQWSKSFIGKSEVVNNLWKSVRETIKQPLEFTVHRIIGEEENVVVEMSGRNTTTSEKSYYNKYCWVCRVKDGKLHEINEYMDTELVTKAFKD